VKKIALMFLIAVFVPSLLLAWLAVRSLRDTQMALERQRWLLYQGVADSLAKEADDVLASRQREFGQQVESMLARSRSEDIAYSFDDRLRTNWAPAEVGFVVTLQGNMSCPSPYGRPAARAFYTDNGKFVCNIQSAEVYWNSTKNGANIANQPVALENNNNSSLGQYFQTKSSFPTKQIARNVVPQQQAMTQDENGNQNFSKVSSSEAEFRQLVGDSTEGMVARFLENKLTLLLWYRSPHDTNLIFGAEMSLPRLKEGLKPVPEDLDHALRDDVAVALLDENARPVSIMPAGFQANWKHPFVATELGEGLPHWELAVYLLNPAKLAESARTLKLTLGLLIVVLLLAICAGGWLIVSDLNRHLTLARQKTDFVSNVSHELKTPLTSIRMFSELLAEGRVGEAEKQKSYLHIIAAEASRLSRLINNVLDFSRMERGEKKYDFQKCDIAALVRETVETYRPHLEANGFQVRCDGPDAGITVNGDRDALAQIVVNLLSNAEKYSDGRKDIEVKTEQAHEPLPYVEARIMDRGTGVPRDCEEKIFDKFYRAHDSLSSGIQGSGLGLTLARQIARAHGGDVVYQPRDGGGSCFILRLPVAHSQST
jgi:signal transduction histidine kinase